MTLSGTASWRYASVTMFCISYFQASYFQWNGHICRGGNHIKNVVRVIHFLRVHALLAGTLSSGSKRKSQNVDYKKWRKINYVNLFPWVVSSVQWLLNWKLHVRWMSLMWHVSVCGGGVRGGGRGKKNVVANVAVENLFAIISEDKFFENVWRSLLRTCLGKFLRRCLSEESLFTNFCPRKMYSREMYPQN